MDFRYTIVFGIVFIATCNAIVHNTGESDLLQIELFSKVLFERTTVQPTNYTIIFKYIGTEFSTPLNYIVIDTHSQKNSTCYFEVNQENDQEKIVQATVSIINGTDVKVTAHVWGSIGALINDNMNPQKKMKILLNKDDDAKTFTVIYKHNATQTRYRKFNLGQRQFDDKQLHFETQNVTIGFRFAEKEFKYNDPTKCITAISFSFESPTANAFINSTFIKEHEFDAIVYDLNFPFFVANMSVYGYDHFDKPASYKSIVNYLQPAIP